MNVSYIQLGGVGKKVVPRTIIKVTDTEVVWHKAQTRTTYYCVTLGVL